MGCPNFRRVRSADFGRCAGRAASAGASAACNCAVAMPDAAVVAAKAAVAVGGPHLENEVCLRVSWRRGQEDELVKCSEHDERNNHVSQADLGGDHVLADEEGRDAARQGHHDLDRGIGPVS